MRLAKALWYESLKRLPYVGLVLVILLLFQGYSTYQKTVESVEIATKNSESNNVLLEKISWLSEDNKKLSEDNKTLAQQSNRLADQANRYQDCIANLFAKYTRDYLPIIIQDLSTCSALNIVPSQGSTGTVVPPSQPSPSEPTTPPAPPPQPGNSEGNRQNPQKEPRSLLNDIFELLGLMLNERTRL